MILIPVGVVWTGYLLVCYGYSEVKGGGLGLLDWAHPGRVGKVLANFGKNKPSPKPGQTPSNMVPGNVGGKGGGGGGVGAS